MALPHAQPLDIIDVRPPSAGLPAAVTTSLLKTRALQLMRLVLPAGQSLPEHGVPGAITVQCLEGETVVTTPSRTCNLSQGQFVVLEGSEPHALKATAHSTLLVLLLLDTNDPQTVAFF